MDASQAAGEEDKKLFPQHLNLFKRKKRKDSIDIEHSQSSSVQENGSLGASVSSDSEDEDDGFLDQLEMGSNLHIHVTHARGVLAMDASGTSDPYCVVEMGNTSHRTSSIKKTLNPTWNETFIFGAEDVRQARGRVKFSVWDADDWSKDDFLGQAKVYLREVPLDSTEMTLELKKSRNMLKNIRQFTLAPVDRGTITVSIGWAPSARSANPVVPTLSLLPESHSGAKFVEERCVSSLCTNQAKTIPAVVHTSVGSIYEEPGIVYLCLQVAKVRVQASDNAKPSCPIQTITKAIARSHFRNGLARRLLSKQRLPFPRLSTQSKDQDSEDVEQELEITRFSSVTAPRSDFLDMWSEFESVDWGEEPKKKDGGKLNLGSKKKKDGESIATSLDDENVESCLIDGNLDVEPYWYYKVDFLKQKQESEVVQVEKDASAVDIVFASQNAFAAVLPVRNKTVEIKLYSSPGENKGKAKLILKWKLHLFDLLDGVQSVWTAEGAQGLKGTIHANCRLIHGDPRAQLFNMEIRDYTVRHSRTGSSANESSSIADSVDILSPGPGDQGLQTIDAEFDADQSSLTSPGSSSLACQTPFLGRFYILIDSLELENPVDCFCVMKFGPHWCKTIEHIATKTCNWQWEIKMPVYDPATMLSFSVFQETRHKGVLSIGKLRMRISTLGPNQAYHTKLPIRSGGSVTGKVKLTMKVVYPSEYLASMYYLKPPLPKDLYMFNLHADDSIKQEARSIILRWLDGSSPRIPNIVARKVLDLEKESFSTKRMRVHIQRIKECFAPLTPSMQKLTALQNWENPMETASICLAMCFAIYFPNLVIFLALFSLAIFSSFIFRIPDSPPPMDDLLLIEDQQEEQEPQSKNKESGNPYLVLKRKYDKIQVILVKVQDILDTLASFFEKIEALVTWRDPVATKLFTAGLCLVAIAVHILGIQFFMCCGALWFLRPPSMRDPLPPPPFSFFVRLPSRSDQVL